MAEAAPVRAIRDDPALAPVLEGFERWYGQQVGQALQDELARRGMSRAQWSRHLGVRDNAYVKKFGRGQHLLVRDLIEIAALLGPSAVPALDVDAYMLQHTDSEWDDDAELRSLRLRAGSPTTSALAGHLAPALGRWAGAHLVGGRGHLLRSSDVGWALVEALGMRGIASERLTWLHGGVIAIDIPAGMTIGAAVLPPLAAGHTRIADALAELAGSLTAVAAASPAEALVLVVGLDEPAAALPEDLRIALTSTNPARVKLSARTLQRIGGVRTARGMELKVEDQVALAASGRVTAWRLLSTESVAAVAPQVDAEQQVAPLTAR